MRLRSLLSFPVRVAAWPAGAAAGDRRGPGPVELRGQKEAVEFERDELRLRVGRCHDDLKRRLGIVPEDKG